MPSARFLLTAFFHLMPSSSIRCLLLGLLLLTAAAATPLRAQTTQTGTIRFGGLVRDYRLYLPAAALAAPTVPRPLLLNLHGYGSNNLEQEAYGDFRAIADTAHFLVLHPNGTFDNGGTSRYWNTFVPPGTPGPDDVGFLLALIDSIRLRYAVDTTRLYSTGMSNGGFMSYELACQRADRFAAIASVTGSIARSHLSACQPSQPVPVLEIHGTADNTVPYNGNAFFAPIPDVLAFWVQANGCGTPVTTPVPNTSTTDGCTAERTVWPAGPSGARVEHYRIIGGAHTWPGSAFTIAVTNRDLNASREVWRFLRGYRRLASQPTAAPTDRPVAGALTVSPNPATTGVVLVRGPRPLRPGQLFATDALGRAVPLSVTPEGDALRLDVRAWPVGIYWLQADGRRTKLVR